MLKKDKCFLSNRFKLHVVTFIRLYLINPTLLCQREKNYSQGQSC